MSSTPFRLLLPRQIHIDMLDHARSELPNECCGLLAGSADLDTGTKRIERLYPLINELASPIAYRSEPRSILAASKDIDRRGLAWLAVYHRTRRRRRSERDRSGEQLPGRRDDSGDRLVVDGTTDAEGVAAV